MRYSVLIAQIMVLLSKQQSKKLKKDGEMMMEVSKTGVCSTFTVDGIGFIFSTPSTTELPT